MAASVRATWTSASGVHVDDMDAHIGERLDVAAGNLGHHVNVAGDGGVLGDPVYVLEPHPVVGDEVAVHEVEVEAVGPRRLEGRHLIAQASEVSAHHRGEKQGRIVAVIHLRHRSFHLRTNEKSVYQIEYN